MLIAWKGFIAGQLERFSICLAVCHLLTSTDILSRMLRLIKLFQRVLRGEAPPVSSYLANKCCMPYDLRRCNKVNVTSFNSYILKSWIRHRGATLFLYIWRMPDLRLFIEMWKRKRTLILVHRPFSRFTDIILLLRYQPPLKLPFFHIWGFKVFK